MFAVFLKFLRLALCASALALIGVGERAGRVEANVAREAADWGAAKRVKLPLIVGARVGAACPLAAAVQASVSRAARPTAAVVFSPAVLSRDDEADSARRACAADRERSRRAGSGVVRLLI